MLDLLLLLLAAPSWLWGCCGRHNSPPASSVMDFVFHHSDGSHVSIDTVHPSLLRSSSLSSPRWYHLQSLSSYVLLRMIRVPRAAGSFTAFYVVVRATTDDRTATTFTTTFYSATKQHTISKQSCGSHSSHCHPLPAGQTSLPLCFTQQELLD